MLEQYAFFWSSESTSNLRIRVVKICIFKFLSCLLKYLFDNFNVFIKFLKLNVPQSQGIMTSFWDCFVQEYSMLATAEVFLIIRRFTVLAVALIP